MTTWKPGHPQTPIQGWIEECHEVTTESLSYLTNFEVLKKPAAKPNLVRITNVTDTQES